MTAAEHRTEILKARTRAFWFRRCQSGNPDGQSRFYHEARKLARHAAPAVREELIELALHAEDERVKSVCAVAVFDRAGVRPIDSDPSEDKAERPAFDPRAYTPEEIHVIEAGLQRMLESRRE